MAYRWFYLHGTTLNGAARNGPYSCRELADLAASGQILPTDTVWKEGIDKGVLARRVKYLFQLAPVPCSGSDGVTLTPVPPLSQGSADASTSAGLPPAVEPEPAPPAETGSGSTEPAAAKQPEENSGMAGAPAEPTPAPIPTEINLMPDGEAPATPVPPSPPPKKVRKGRAVAGKGALIVGQDGINVKFKKKCTTCAHEDGTRNTLKITNGMTRLSFYCPKCRKKRDVEIQGFLN